MNDSLKVLPEKTEDQYVRKDHHRDSNTILRSEIVNVNK